MRICTGEAQQDQLLRHQTGQHRNPAQRRIRIPAGVPDPELA